MYDNTMLLVVTLIGPIIGSVLAIQTQKWIEKKRGKKDARENIFKQLMATRGTPRASNHVTALNMIEIEFYGGKFQSVRSSWRKYLSHLITPSSLSPDVWDSKRKEILAVLLANMANSLGYKNVDETTVSDGCYTPNSFSYEDTAKDGLIQVLLAMFDKRPSNPPHNTPFKQEHEIGVKIADKLRK